MFNCLVKFYPQLKYPDTNYSVSTYSQDAMEYFRDEFGPRVAFVFVSDEMQWGRRALNKEENVYFVGCGDGDDPDCIGKDFALLSSCNHTITTHGTFGHWAAYMAGGEVYTEYGAIVPDAYYN